jgi:hypothetical protein
MVIVIELVWYVLFVMVEGNCIFLPNLHSIAVFLTSTAGGLRCYSGAAPASDTSCFCLPLRATDPGEGSSTVTDMFLRNYLLVLTEPIKLTN